MATEIRTQYLLKCGNPDIALDLIRKEVARLTGSKSVQNEAKRIGVGVHALKSLEVNFTLDEHPAFSPGELATLAVTIILLDPLGNVVEKALSDVWEQVIFPRILDWIAAKNWEITSPANITPERGDSPFEGARAMVTKIVSVNPSTGDLIADFQPSSPDDVKKAVDRARKAFSDWKSTSVGDRLSLFGNLAKLMGENAEAIINLIETETGKRKSDAEYEIYDIIAGVAHYCRQLRLITDSDHTVPLSFLPHGTKYDTIPELRFEPHGVVAAIMPWNFPFWIPMANIIPAILAGNTVVFKPSENSTLVGKKIAELFGNAGFPPGVLELVIGADEVGRALVLSNVNFIFFTGSVEAGQEVKRNAGMRPVELELGGNSASIVCESANVELAVEGTVWGALYNAGQSCSGHKRVFVHRKISKKFIEMVESKVKSLQPGRDYGPYIRRPDMMRVHERVADAVSKGAVLICGGKILERLPVELKEGFWYEPTVLVYTKDDLLLVTNETFGNVLPIRVVDSDEEAIALANATSYGLTNILWTTDYERGQVLADQLESGMVFINEAELALVAGEYWGGWKNSGLGVVGNKIERCLRQKLVVTYTGTKPREYWFPYK